LGKAVALALPGRLRVSGRFGASLALVALLLAGQSTRAGDNSVPPPGSLHHSPDGAKAKPQEPEPTVPKAPKIDLTGDVEDRTPIRSWQDANGMEAKAYYRTLITAHTTSAEAFANSARHDVRYVHLFEEPHKYRGEVIHVEGRLKRVRRFDTHGFVRNTYDMPYEYEGWLFDPVLYGANPLCVVFTELPPGIAVKEEMDVRVSFDGYFFKRYRYKAADAWRDAPLLIGHAPVVQDSLAASQNTDSGFSNLLVTCLLALLAGTFGFGVIIYWWYQRGDREVRRRLAATRPAEFVEPESGVRDQGSEVSEAAADLSGALTPDP
jgi:hypothetical protein